MKKVEKKLNNNKTVREKEAKKRSLISRIKKKIRKKYLDYLKNNSTKYKFAKKKYSEILYRKYYPKHQNTIEKTLNLYYKNHTKEEKLMCIKDMIFSKITYGISYAEYFMFRFANKKHQERKNFISNDDMHLYLNYLNSIESYYLLKNKYDLYVKYKDFYKRDLVYIESENDYEKFEQFCLKHRFIVKKPVKLAKGTGIELIDTKGKDLKVLFNEILNTYSEFVIEEKIKQSKEMAKLHPESVNTIRIVPFMKEDGTVIIHYPFLKIGQKGSFVDNGGAGGILASIDAETGKVISDGIDEKMKVYKKHPDTKIMINGFQIPDWDGVKTLATKLVKENPSARYVGWDFAHTSKGWIVVEGNGKTMFIGQQMPLDKGIKKDLEELIDWKNVPNKDAYKKKKAH